MRMTTRASASHVLIAIMLAGCATVPRSSVVEPAADAPMVSPALQTPTGKFLKRKVAVARFSNETTYGKSPLLGEDILGKQASDIITSRLAASEKFVLFDDEVVQQSISAPDFRLIGSVSEFGRATSSDAGVFSKTKTQVARATVNLRLVDVRTGIVVFSAEGRGEATSSTGKVLGVGTAQGFDSTLSEKAISAAISNVVGTVAERMLDAPWQSIVLAVDGVQCTIGGGLSQGLAPGDRLQVVQRGKSIKNPQTGAFVELPGKPVAEILVKTCHGTNYADEFSTCEIASGAIADIPVEQLCIQAKEGGSQ